MSRPKSTRRKPRRRDDPAVLEALRVDLAARLDRLRATIEAKRADCARGIGFSGYRDPGEAPIP